MDRPKAIGYARVSTPGQRDKGYSFTRQASGIITWAKLTGHTLVCIEFETCSRSVHWQERPVLQSVIERARREGAVILAECWDRVDAPIDYLTVGIATE